MKRLTVLQLMLASSLVAAFSLLTAATASALVVLLPEETTARTASDKADGSTNPKFETTGGTFFECTSATAETTEAASGKPEGSFHVKFQGCKGHQGGLTVGCKEFALLALAETVSAVNVFADNV